MVLKVGSSEIPKSKPREVLVKRHVTGPLLKQDVQVIPKGTNV